MMTRPWSALIAVGMLAALTLGAVASGAKAPNGKAKPAAVHSKSAAAKAKLDPRLQEKVDAGVTATVPVFAVVKGDASAVAALLTDAHVAAKNGAALVVGRAAVPRLTKVAGLSQVLSVGLLEFKQTGAPLGNPEPGLNKKAPKGTLLAAVENLRKNEVAYADAPAPAGSQLAALRAKPPILDAKTHRFADAWDAGYLGEGSTVSVLDGGTDWAHPDLLGTWKTGADGWPEAYDPYGTLLWLAAPDFIELGLSWQTLTQAPTALPQTKKDAKDGIRRVRFATRLGPSRNFAAPDGTVAHVYTFPASWTRAGSAPVLMGSHPDDHLLQLYSERPAYLLLDKNADGAYETVYVDLDGDYEFTDEKPVTKASPASYRDMNGDGYIDISGGLLYFIADGEAPVPGGLVEAFGEELVLPAGALVAWTGDFDPALEGHGTLTASNVVGQAVINGRAPSFADYGTYPGAVIGGAPKAKLVPMGDIYFSFDFSTQLGYLLTTLAGVDVTSNSYGTDYVDNDGYDAASQEADIWHALINPNTTPLFSTGNGAPGFGTVAPPTPSRGLAIGASTQFGGTGWDSIANAGQIVENDVMVWSNRGPGATGSPGVDVVADGAFSAGDTTLNTILDGRNAWETWGGTSRSTPVAAAATALVYQAYRASHGGEAPTNVAAKNILKSSAVDLGYGSFIQGAGSVDAAQAVEAAAGTAAVVSPNEWRAGSYRGTEYGVFTHIVAPGGSDTQAFSVAGAAGPVSVSDRVLKQVSTQTREFTTAPLRKESVYNFNAPDYLIDLSDVVQQHPNADLMVIRGLYPHTEFDGDQDYAADQAWRMNTYNWTDVNGNGRLWADHDRDGVVDHKDANLPADKDGNIPLDFKKGEIEQGEYIRFMYHRPGANSLMSFVRNPAQRMADGLLLGLQHAEPNAAHDVTHFTFRIDFYENVDWPWVTGTPTAGGFSAQINVPAGTPYGMYEGALEATVGGRTTIVPVSVAVAATATQNAAGAITGSTVFGGQRQADSLYDNGSIFGANDWTWRKESGDWRFFFMDVLQAPPAGTLFLSNTTWEDEAPFTDLDTIVMGRSANTYQLIDFGPIFAPYILDTVGKSEDAYIGTGTWLFDTATDGAHEIVAAPAQAGLHSFVQHGVSWQGDKFDTPFQMTVGSASVSPSSVVVDTPGTSGSFDVTFTSSVALPGLDAEAFGLSQPVVLDRIAHQDDPDVPSSASVKETVAVAHASRATFSTDLAGSDVDLFVVYDANNDGTFAPSEIVGSSTTATGVESVTLITPPDGNYQVWVQGWAITGDPPFQLRIDIVQGNDLTVSGVPAGPIAAGVPVTLTVSFDKPAMVAGQSYFGDLLLGPDSAPTALRVPIRVNKS